MSLFLLDAVLKATVLLGGAAVLTAMLRRSSAASRHLIWTVALAAALVLPALSTALPRWQVPVITLAPGTSAAVATVDDAAAREMASRLFARLRANDAGATATSPATATSTPAREWSWSALAFAAWALGAALILARLLLGLVAVQVLARRTTSADNAPWMPLANQLARDLGLTKVIFRRSREATMPMAWGVWRSTVALPADADTWPDDRLRIVLLHELAHVKRRDCLTHMLAQVACAFYWFNPLAWVAARHVRAERERACDDLVLAAGTPGADYADQLLEIARVMRAGRFSSVVAGASLAMAQRSQLEGRLMAILDPSVPRTAVSRVRSVAAAAIAAATIVPLASLQAWSVEPSAPSPAPTVQAAPSPAPTPAPVQIAVQQPARAVVAPDQTVVKQAVKDKTREREMEREIEREADNASGQESKGKADPKVVAALTAALKDTDKEVRETALHALVQLRDPGVFEPLLQALKDGSPDMREQAAFGLGQMRDKRAVEPLLAAMKDQNDNVREQVVFALGQLRDVRATEGLISALKDTHANVREQAAFALGQLRASSAVEALVVALKDAGANVREQAAFALGQIRDPRAIDGLTTALKDANANVRQQAAFALGQLAR